MQTFQTDSTNTLKNIMGDQKYNLLDIPEGRPMTDTEMKDIVEMISQSPNQKNPVLHPPKAKPRQTTNQVVNHLSKNQKKEQKDQTLETKEELIFKIQKYQNSSRFGDFITKDLKIDFSRDKLLKMKIEQLEAMLHRIRIHLNNRNMDAIIKNMVHTCAFGYERTLSPFYNIDGFTNLLCNNQEFWDAVERWKIENELPDIPPGIQISYIVMSTTLMAHELNKLQSAVNTTPEPVQNQITK